MSGTIDLPEDDPRLLAAEYVLGTLDAQEMRAADARRATDPQFDADILLWEVQLAPLSLLAPPVPPPASLWARIEDSVASSASRPVAAPLPSRAANDNGRRAWRNAALASSAIAAGLLAFILIRPPSAPVLEVAVLAPTGSKATLLVAASLPGGSFLVRPTQALALDAGRDLELWALPQGATKPVALGLLPAAGATLPPGIQPGTQILVSLEPKGGSPTGLPTGPVVYGGKLLRLE